MGIVTSVPIGCTILSEKQFGFLIARSIELSDSKFEGLQRDVEEVSLIFNFENLYRELDTEEEEDLEDVIKLQKFPRS